MAASHSYHYYKFILCVQDLSFFFFLNQPHVFLYILKSQAFSNIKWNNTFHIYILIALIIKCFTCCSVLLFSAYGKR